MIKIIKPGTPKYLWVTPEEFEQYKTFGWEQEQQEQQEVRAVLKPRKKTAKAEPAVEDVSSNEEVGIQDELKGE